MRVKRYGVSINGALHERLRQRCGELGVSVNSLVETISTTAHLRAMSAVLNAHDAGCECCDCHAEKVGI